MLSQTKIESDHEYFGVFILIQFSLFLFLLIFEGIFDFFISPVLSEVFGSFQIKISKI